MTEDNPKVIPRGHENLYEARTCNTGNLKWCCKQKRGIELVEFKPHLDESYMNESREDVKAMGRADNKWKVIIAYYACYEAVYSLLVRAGIKCEIHDCSLELMILFDFNEEDIIYIKELKKLREGNQYYLKDNILKDEKKVGEFISKCREIFDDLNSDKIDGIRNKLKELIK